MAVPAKRLFLLLAACCLTIVSQAYGYDELNRLSSAAEGSTWSRSYLYDRYGNRAMQGTTPTPAVGPLCAIAANPGCNSSTTALTPAYVPSTNRLISAWADYDTAGNMLAFKDPIGAGTRDWSAVYDAENKQRFYCDGTTAACSASNDTAEYVYDGEGNRVKKITASETVTYVYDAFGRLAAEYSTAGPSGASGSYFRTVDHLGSTRLVTNGSGAVHDRRDLFPFGEQIPASYSNRSSAGDYNDLNPASAHLFTAKERDQESGLDYFLARYYGSSLGRFTSVDPANAGAASSNPQSWNGYAYTLGNPLAFVDPSGAVTVCATEGDTSCTPSDDPDGFRIVVTATAQAPDGPAEPIQTDSQKASISAITGQVGATAPLVNTLFAISTSVTGFTGGGTAALSLNLASKGAAAGKAGSTITTATGLRQFFPPNNGFLGQPQRTFLEPGQLIDRVGGLGGKFFSPSGTPLPLRALPPGSANSALTAFRVLKPIESLSGTTAPAFGQIGLGTQYLTPVSAQVLLRRGFLEVVR